jgi:hypothetical protein
MKDKIIDWCTIHRKKIAYTIAGLNFLSGLSLLSSGQNTNGWTQIFVGSVILLDTMTRP